MTRAWAAAAAIFATGACATNQRLSPHDASAAEHSAAAAQADVAASAHGAQYDPEAWRTRDCSGIVRGELAPCWTSTTNPTESHLREQRLHHELAERHRAALQVLRDAEQRACAGLPSIEREESPFSHVEDIERVEILAGPGGSVRGSSIFFRSVPGLTAESLQRLVDCHLARNSVIGHDRPEMAFCPLTLRRITAVTRAAGSSIAVDVASDDQDTAGTIVERAQALVHDR